MISCEGVGKRFSRQWVFRRVSLSAEVGQCLLLTGPNGSGKSTLLKLLAGLEPPSEGSVSREFDTRASMGYSATDLRLYPNLTADEHLRFAGTMRGLPEEASALERVGLCDVSGKLVGTFSTGMRARLKLALALLGEPKALLLDEPGAGLDEEGRAILDAAVSEQKARGIVILATNDPAERRFGDFELVLGA
ncbi:MAG: ATP-binding cassette domain-containing protein [Fimbriimonadales bacterium]